MALNFNALYPVREHQTLFHSSQFEVNVVSEQKNDFEDDLCKKNKDMFECILISDYIKKKTLDTKELDIL